jgi:hypothetical protein
MALTWTALNTIRAFHNVPFDDILPAEQRFLERWRAIPAERRQAALDFAIPAKPEPTSEEERQGRIEKIRKALEEEEARERAARIAKIREALNES